MGPIQWIFRVFGLLCVVGLAGCKVPAQIVWSPDGAAAAYRVEDKAFLIDSSGKIVTPLGASAGGYAWSADSKTLYFANTSEVAAGPVALPESKWLSPKKLTKPDAAESPATQPSKPAKFVELQAFAGNKATLLATFAADKAIYMALSPDQTWLAVVCVAEEPNYALYVLHVPSKRLFTLGESTGFALCFTGPNRLAFTELDGPIEGNECATGKVVEVMLNAAATSLDRTPLLDVIPAQTPFLAALGDNLLLTSTARSFPGKATRDDKLICKLFMWTRANSGIVSLSDDVGPLFALSPDGKNILIEKITPANEQTAAKRELQIIRANGSSGQSLRDLSQRDIFALWPAWHGNDEITFTSAEDDAKPGVVNGDSRLIYDLVQYKLTDKGLQSSKILSEGWDTGMKPFLPIQSIGATQPTTKD